MYKRIRDLREDMDLSQKDIAKVLNVAQATYSRYENGTLDIKIALLIKLANFYSTSIDYLVGQTDDSRPYRPSSKKTNG